MKWNLITARPGGETEARKRDLPKATSYGDAAQNFAVLVLNFPLARALARLGFSSKHGPQSSFGGATAWPERGRGEVKTSSSAKVRAEHAGQQHACSLKEGGEAGQR